MKSPLCTLLPLFLAVLPLACSPEGPAKAAPPAMPREVQALAVEASCGTCKFLMPGKDCALAVRIDGRTHFVDGATLDDHGDAHAPEGLCNTVRKAKVSGRFEGERFVATSFELLPQ